jgi:acetylornithine deacetylase
VPGRLVAEGRLGLRIEEDPAAARAELECRVGVVAEADPYLRDHPPVGIPTLHSGPGDVRLAHGPEEAVEVDEVIRVVEALVLTALRTCGTLD